MTKFLQDSWYCIGWATELEEKPIGITVCDTYVVAYRDSKGDIVAMDGRCPHRFAPLDLGVVKGDAIACPYHGLEFDGTGKCILNPHGPGVIPPNAVLKTYPALENMGAIWIWMGDPALADPSSLPQLAWWGSKDYAVSTGHLRLDVNYQLVMDNLLDLTHGPYLHAGTLSGDPESTVHMGMQHSWKTEPGPILHSDYYVEKMPRPAPQMELLVGDVPGEMSANMRWRPASILDLEVSYKPEGCAEGEGAHIPSVHYLAPESDTVTHYFYALGRNKLIDSEEMTRIQDDLVRKAFTEEDEPMMQACQALMGTTDLMSLNPAILQTDAPGVQARRLLKKVMA